MTAAEQLACDCDPATICTEHRQMPDLDGYRTYFDAPAMTTRTDHALFVRAARYLLSDLWSRNDVKAVSGEQGVSFGRDPIDVTYWRDKHLEVVRYDGPSGETNALRLVPGAIQEAVDHLVIAGVLPTEMASWAAEYVPAIDFDGDRIGMLGNELWTMPDGSVDDAWEPLYRRVPAADKPVCYAKDALTWPVDVPRDGDPYVAKHVTSGPVPGADIPGCYRHTVMYASRMNCVLGGVRVTAQAVTA